MVIQVKRLMTKFSQTTCAPTLLAFRNMSNISTKTLLYKEYGEPAKVVQFTTDKVNKPQGNEVRNIV